MGYYQEDAATNPEDPLPGSLHLSLPKQDGAFEGSFLFSYVGCQSRNLGQIQGIKTSSSLDGDWSGTVDNTAQEGRFTGVKDDDGFFSGRYTVAGGKQNIVVDGCIDYFIAPFGTWFLFPVNQDRQDDELLKFENNSAVWTPVPNSVATQCALIEVDEANCGDATNAVWQDVAISTDTSLAIPETSLRNSSRYTLTCTQFDNQGNRLAFSKTNFVYNSPVDDPEPPKIVPLSPIYFLLNSD